jgi:N-acetylmuramoyl-L-alanine amidase
VVEQLTRNEQVVGSSPTVGSASRPPNLLFLEWPVPTSGKLFALLCLCASLLPVLAHGQLSLVVLDPGHGGENLGAPARFHKGQYEKHFTLPLARHVAEELRKAGIGVVLTREDDRDMELWERVSMANRLGADVFVSLHMNSTHKPGPSGHISYLLSVDASDEAARRLADFENQNPTTVSRRTAPKTDATEVEDILLDLTRNQAHQDSQKLAAAIQSNLKKHQPFENRGVKQAPFNVLKGAAMPAAVCEVGFINHPQEGRFITSEDGMRKIAKGIARGILEFGRTVLPTEKQAKSGDQQ